MRLNHFLTHLHGSEMSRRDALKLAAKAGTIGAVAMTVGGLCSETAHAEEGLDEVGEPEELTISGFNTENDEMFDVQAVENGAWAPGPYGAGDQRGTFNEVTPRKTAQALRLLARNKPVVTYNLGDAMFNGFPAFRTNPPRIYDQTLTITGYQPPADFKGILQTVVPLGPNKVSIHEERFAINGTYQIATQIDNLNHIGVGAMFYNGYRGPDIAATTGTKALGNEHMGPIITRGILLDIIGLKVSQGATGHYFKTGDGRPVLNDNYRITIEDMEAAMRKADIRRIGRGDVVLLRTGWNQLVRPDPERYLAQEPGIFLRETRYLAQFRPAMVGGDSWGLEVLDPAVTKGNAFPCHQELLVHYGIRIGEGIKTDALAEDGVYEFVYIVTPQYAPGATAGNTPPAALGQPKGK